MARTTKILFGKSFQKWFRNLFYHGRAWQLRVFLILLAVASGLFLLFSLVELRGDFQQAGSWRGFWGQEWRSGRSILDVLGSGLFQAFVLILGWSAWFRFRQREMAHLRLRRSEQK